MVMQMLVFARTSLATSLLSAIYVLVFARTSLATSLTSAIYVPANVQFALAGVAVTVLAMLAGVAVTILAMAAVLHGKWTRATRVLPALKDLESWISYANSCEGSYEEEMTYHYQMTKIVPLERRQHVMAVYAFLHMIDDIVDKPITECAPQVRMEAVDNARKVIDDNDALVAILERYKVPKASIDEYCAMQKEICLWPVSSSPFSSIHEWQHWNEKYFHCICCTIGPVLFDDYQYNRDRSMGFECLMLAMQVANLCTDRKKDEECGQHWIPSDTTTSDLFMVGHASMRKAAALGIFEETAFGTCDFIRGLRFIYVCTCRRLGVSYEEMSNA